VTIEAWIKATAYTNQYMPIIYKGDKLAPGSSNRSYSLWLTSGNIWFTSGPGNPSGLYVYSPGSLALNIWYHVAGVIDTKRGVMKIILNGTEVARKDFGKDIHVSTLPLRIGWTHEEDPSCSPFAGQIDEVRIWNIARTEDEILTTMYTSLSGKESGLVGYWRFDDDNNVAIDSSPGRSDGKLVGDAHFRDSRI
jgi:hypothetical protein